MIDDWIELFESVFGFWFFIMNSSFRKRKIEQWKGRIRKPIGWITVPAEVLAGIAGGVIPIGVAYWFMTSN